MTKPLLAALALTLTVSACGAVRESRFNPFNWFGGATSAPATAAPERLVAADRRELAAALTDLTLEPTPDGAILRVTALPPTQGYWDAVLVPLETSSQIEETGKVTFEYRYRKPLQAMATSTPAARQIVAAAFISKRRLAMIKEIQVNGATNSLTSRR